MRLLCRLVSFESLSGTAAEIPMAEEIADLLSTLPYFRRNRQHLFRQTIPDDPLGRSYVAALVKGRGQGTVILLSHFDVVDVEDFRGLRSLAFDPVSYTKALAPQSLPPEAARDLQSGRYLFGRGVMDMKAGLALHLSLLERCSAKAEALPGSILLLTVPDEESSSAGMIGAVPFLNRLAEQEGLRYLAVINSEPSFPRFAGDENQYLYTGTIGKLLPMFYFAGEEAHAGNPFAGLSADLLCSELNRLLEVNPDFCDRDGDTVTAPPICLRQSDWVPHYSVTLPNRAYAWYNYLTLRKTPDRVLQEMVDAAKTAFRHARRKVAERAVCHAAMTGFPPAPILWEERVITFAELWQEAVACYPALTEEIDRLIAGWREQRLDDREISFRLVREVHRRYPARGPMIVVLFAPPYYPHHRVSDEGWGGQVKEVAKQVAALAKEEFGEELILQDYFPGLCDFSYCAMPYPEKLSALSQNMPVWGRTYRLPVNEIATFSTPVLNIGPRGFDAHKPTERLDTVYSFTVTPRLLQAAVEALWAKGGIIL